MWTECSGERMGLLAQLDDIDMIANPWNWMEGALRSKGWGEGDRQGLWCDCQQCHCLGERWMWMPDCRRQRAEASNKWRQRTSMPFSPCVVMKRKKRLKQGGEKVISAFPFAQGKAHNLGLQVMREDWWSKSWERDEVDTLVCPLITFGRHTCELMRSSLYRYLITSCFTWFESSHYFYLTSAELCIILFSARELLVSN